MTGNTSLTTNKTKVIHCETIRVTVAGSRPVDELVGTTLLATLVAVETSNGVVSEAMVDKILVPVDADPFDKTDIIAFIFVNSLI